MTKLIIHCDGGARGNPGPAASAFVVYDESQSVVYQQGNYLGETTNNQAEYSAVLNAVKWAGKHYPDAQLNFFLDSQLVASQLAGKYKIKNLELKKIYNDIQKIISENHLQVTGFNFVYRSKNFLADSLVNKTLDDNL